MWRLPCRFWQVSVVGHRRFFPSNLRPSGPPDCDATSQHLPASRQERPTRKWRLANPLSQKKGGTQAVMALNHLSGQDKQLQQESQKTSGTNERHLADYRSGTARIFPISNFSAQSGLPFDYFSLSRPTLRVEVLESLLRRNHHALICM